MGKPISGKRPARAVPPILGVPRSTASALHQAKQSTAITIACTNAPPEYADPGKATNGSRMPAKRNDVTKRSRRTRVRRIWHLTISVYPPRCNADRNQERLPRLINHVGLNLSLIHISEPTRR